MTNKLRIQPDLGQLAYMQRARDSVRPDERMFFDARLIGRLAAYIPAEHWKEFIDDCLLYPSELPQVAAGNNQ